MNVIDCDIKAAVDKELQAATERFGLHHSNHEKMAVIAEEYEECEEAIAKLRQSVHCAWSRTRDNCDRDMMDDAYGRIYGAAVNLAIEACQTAAMADKEIKRMEKKTMANVCDEYAEIDVGECTCENCMTCDDKGINMTECMALHGLIDTDYFEKE